jgi:hypothetical protein
MNKADSPNTTSPSRRTVLAGISVAAAASAPVSAIAQRADRELIALGEQLYALLPELTAARLASYAAVDAADVEAWCRAGLDEHHDGNGGGDPLTEDEQRRLWAMLKVVRAELGTENAIAACDEVWRRADIIHREIIALPAHGLTGVAVKARAAAVLVLAHLWDEPMRDLDREDEITRNLIESICAAAGMPLPWSGADAA